MSTGIVQNASASALASAGRALFDPWGDSGVEHPAKKA